MYVAAEYATVVTGDIMTLNAKLRAAVEVDGKVIAESDDAVLCATILRLLSSPPGHDGAAQDAAAHTVDERCAGPDGLARLSQDLSLAPAQIIGSIDPSPEPPFIRINKRCWEAFASRVPRKGRGAVAPLAVVLTVLAVWKESAGLGNATIDEGYRVLQALGLEDKNRKRTIENCEWLLVRGNHIVLNPNETSRAFELARALCEKRAPASRTQKDSQEGRG